MGWVEAEDLKVGYPLYRGDQGTLAIVAIESERRVETVYNLRGLTVPSSINF
jgi:hypothetical protein